MAKDTKANTKEAEVVKTVAELRKELLTAQKSLRDGTLTNPHSIRDIKKQIARRLTAENAAKLVEVVKEEA